MAAATFYDTGKEMYLKRLRIVSPRAFEWVNERSDLTWNKTYFKIVCKVDYKTSNICKSLNIAVIKNDVTSSGWHDPQVPQVIVKPPYYSRRLGRPREARFRTVMKPPRPSSRAQTRCSNCGVSCHNRITCGQLVRS